MAVFKVKAKNRVDIDKKPRVYFTCHPDDFEKHFKKVCDDIFKTHNCAIYYTEDMTEVIAEDEKQVDLGRNNLFVVPVTYRLLSTPNRAIDEDIPYALKEHIPVLPIMMEPGIDEFYSKPDKFGELQYLNPYSTDLTEISYEEKLKKYLESVLISDKLAKRVRAAFDAYIFLSYRKKDRKYANELMRLIHSIPECRDIAIWFDEFLTPGESFKENIEKILDDCKLFTLLVSPQLLEKVIDDNGEERDNYVISTELPLAHKKKQEKGTDIFAVEMEDTDKEALSAIDIDDYVNSGDETFRVRLLETISRMAITTNNTPEHNFLIGLAYLEGIDVEVDRNRGVELVTLAANAGLLEATKKLRDMYHNGIVVERNYNIALKLSEKVITLCEDEFGIDSLEIADAYEELACLCYEMDDYDNATMLLKQVYTLKIKLLGEKHDDTLQAMHNYAVSCYWAGTNYFSHENREGKFYYTFGNAELIEESIALFEKIYSIQVDIKGECVESLLTLCYLALAYSKSDKWCSLAEDCRQRAYEKIKCASVLHREYIACLITLAKSYDGVDLHKKLQFSRMAYALSSSIFGSDNLNTVQAMTNLADALSDIGSQKSPENEEDEVAGNDEYREAIKLLEEIYSYEVKLLGDNHINTLNTLFKLSTIYTQLVEYKKEFEALHKIFECQCVIFGNSDPRALQTLEMMANTCYVIRGEYSETVELVKQIYNLRCEIYGEIHPDTINSLNGVAKAYSDQGDFDSALSLYDKSFHMSCEVFGDDSSEAVRAHRALAECYYQHKQYHMALAVCQEIIDNPKYAEKYKTTTLYLLAKLYYMLFNKTKAFALCDKMQKEGFFQECLPTDIQTIVYFEATDYILDVEDCIDLDDFKEDYNIYKSLLKAVRLVEFSGDLKINLQRFNLIRAIIYDRLAYYCQKFEKYPNANLYYSLAVMFIITEARKSLDLKLYTTAINYLEKYAIFCEKHDVKDKSKIYCDIRFLLQLESEKIQSPQSINPIIDEKKHDETKNRDCLSPEILSELQKIFDDIFIQTTSEEEIDYSKRLFDEDFEENLIESLLQKLFQLGLASSLRRDVNSDDEEITLTDSTGHKVFYQIFDIITLNDEEFLLVSSLKEKNDILIFRVNKQDDSNDKCHLPSSTYELLICFYENLK